MMDTKIIRKRKCIESSSTTGFRKRRKKNQKIDKNRQEKLQWTIEVLHFFYNVICPNLSTIEKIMFMNDLTHGCSLARGLAVKTYMASYKNISDAQETAFEFGEYEIGRLISDKFLTYPEEKYFAKACRQNDPKLIDWMWPYYDAACDNDKDRNRIKLIGFKNVCLYGDLNTIRYYKRRVKFLKPLMLKNTDLFQKIFERNRFDVAKWIYKTFKLKPKDFHIPNNYYIFFSVEKGGLSDMMEWIINNIYDQSDPNCLIVLAAFSMSVSIMQYVYAKFGSYTERGHSLFNMGVYKSNSELLLNYCFTATTEQKNAVEKLDVLRFINEDVTKMRIFYTMVSKNDLDDAVWLIKTRIITLETFRETNGRVFYKFWIDDQLAIIIWLVNVFGFEKADILHAYIHGFPLMRNITDNSKTTLFLLEKYGITQWPKQKLLYLI